MPRTWSAVLARTGVKTGDGRILSTGGGTSRGLPLPLRYQPSDEGAHKGAIVVGRIETMRFDDGMVTATGSLLEEGGWTVLESLEAGVIGPSVDLADFEYVMDADENIVLTKWEVAGATLVAIPAFADVSLTLDPLPAQDTEKWPMAEYDSYDAYAASLTTFALETQAVLDAPAALPEAEWFQDPEFTELMPLTITEAGRVFGHIAPWGQCHIGLPGCVTAPHSLSGYAHFTTGAQAVQGGGTVPVGTLVTGPRHATPEMTFRAAQQHYDDVGAAVAKVTAGEDEFGIWVSGWLLPDADPGKLDQFMASPVSGDWRQVGGSLELIAVCSVNAPGFPVPRARVGFANGSQGSLTASFGIKMERQAEDAHVGMGQADVAPVLAVQGAQVTAARAAWLQSEWKRAGV